MLGEDSKMDTEFVKKRKRPYQWDSWVTPPANNKQAFRDEMKADTFRADTKGGIHNTCLCLPNTK